MGWVYVVTAICCAQIPLLNVLGYEAAMVFGVVSAVVVLLTIELPYKRESFVSWWIRETVKQIIPLMTPIIVFGLNSIVVQNCDWLGGVQFWFVIPVLTVVIVSGMVGVVSQITASRIRTIVLILLLCDVVFLLWRLAWWPPVSGFNILIGWFAGSIYDEALTLPLNLVLYRLNTILILVLLGMFCQIVKGDKSNFIIFHFSWLACTLVLSFSIFSAPIVLRDSKWVQSELGASLQTEHFIVYFDPSDISQKEELALKQDLEFRYREMKEFFDEDPVQWKNRKIEVFLYPNTEVQQRLIGTRNTFVARPWTHQMHLRWTFGSTALAHELSHLFSAPFGGWLLTLPTHNNGLVNIGLLEGVAVAADWPLDQYSPHVVSSVLLEENLLPNIEEAFDPMGFWKNPSGKAYYSMGSFVRWLIDEYGIEKMKGFYQGTEFHELYIKNLKEAISEWKLFLKDVQVNKIHKKQILIRFDRKSIFQKVCARRIAEQVRIIEDFERNRRYDDVIRSIDTLLDWREYPYFNCKKQKILLENSTLDGSYSQIVPPEDMFDKSAVYWMDLYLSHAVKESKKGEALSVLDDLESWPVSQAWKRRFLVQRQLIAEHSGLEYFKTTYNTVGRIEWLEVQYGNGILYEYLLAVNQAALGQQELLLQRIPSSDWPVELRSHFAMLQLYASLQKNDVSSAVKQLVHLNDSPRFEEFRERIDFVRGYSD